MFYSIAIYSSYETDCLMDPFDFFYAFAVKALQRPLKFAWLPLFFKASKHLKMWPWTTGIKLKCSDIKHCWEQESQKTKPAKNLSLSYSFFMKISVFNIRVKSEIYERKWTWLKSVTFQI